MKKIIPIFIVLIAVQFIFSFLFPAYPPHNLPEEANCWKTIEEMGLAKGYSYDSLDNKIAQKIFPLLANYHINCDAGGYMLLANDFPQHYFRGHLANLNRPLYPFLVFLISRPFYFINKSYALTFLSGLLVNFLLFFFTVFLFYLLVKKFVSQRVAFLSSILLIFSPFAHVWLIQPETNIFGAFMVVLSLYLLERYISRPSLSRLIIFSLIIGALTLGKMFFAVSIFILLLSLFSKRYKEGFLFLFIHLIPRLLWYFWVIGIFKIGYFATEITDFNMGVWVLNIFKMPWYETSRIILDAIPKFVAAPIFGFLLLPLIFAVIGFGRLEIKKKNLIYFSFFSSFFILFLLMRHYTARHGFLMFPAIYPLTILGIEKTADFLKKYQDHYWRIFYIAIFAAIIIISSLNIFKVFPYDTGIEIFSWTPSPLQNEIPASRQSEKKLTLLIDNGVETWENSEFEFKERITAFDLLKEGTEKWGLSLKTKNYDMGIFIEAIGSKKNGQSQKYWLYYVNGELPLVSADKKELSPGDKVDFKFEKSPF